MKRLELGVKPSYKRVDTCAAEFEADTPYMYSSYDLECVSAPTTRKKCIFLEEGLIELNKELNLIIAAVTLPLPYRMFYFFFESRNKKTNDPVVIWLTGGPGCGEEIALFYENGPFHITNNLSLVWNDFGWDKVSNIIYVDQPTGTGFSYSSKEDDLRHDEQGISQDFYDFLQTFFKEHPQFAKNDFYITGESYAGHYIPAFAARIQQGNRNKQGLHINLKVKMMKLIAWLRIISKCQKPYQQDCVSHRIDGLT